MKAHELGVIGENIVRAFDQPSASSSYRPQYLLLQFGAFFCLISAALASIAFVVEEMTLFNNTSVAANDALRSAQEFTSAREDGGLAIVLFVLAGFCAAIRDIARNSWRE